MIKQCPRCNNDEHFVACVAEWHDYACDRYGKVEEWLAGEMHGVVEYRCMLCYAVVEEVRTKKPTTKECTRLHPRSCAPV